MKPTLRWIRDGWDKTWPEIHCAISGGVPNFLLSRQPSELCGGVPVFCYHEVDPRGFKADLRFLSHNQYTTLTADELANYLDGSDPIPPRSVVLTFDDGMSNLYSTAFPLLRDYGFTAVAFICPRFHEDANSHGVCTWQEIEQMHESGVIDFQSHTNEHRSIPRWPEPIDMIGVVNSARRGETCRPTIHEDFLQSKHTIEQRLGKVVRHLAFPRYNGTDEAIQIGESLGYRGFWWGGMPGRPLNRLGDPLTHIVRLPGEYLRRLPGIGRARIQTLLAERCARHIRSFRNRLFGARIDMEVCK